MKKKSIVSLALLTSANAFALGIPPQATRTICLQTFEDHQGLTRLSDCDASRNNEILNRQVFENGCAEGQAALVAKSFNGTEWTINIPRCMPPNLVQL